MAERHVLYGSGAPTIAPNALGQHYIDTTNRVPYISVGVESATDWIQGVAEESGGGAGKAWVVVNTTVSTLVINDVLADHTIYNIQSSSEVTIYIDLLLDLTEHGFEVRFCNNSGFPVTFVGNNFSSNPSCLEYVLAKPGGTVIAQVLSNNRVLLSGDLEEYYFANPDFVAPQPPASIPSGPLWMRMDTNLSDTLIVSVNTILLNGPVTVDWGDGSPIQTLLDEAVDDAAYTDNQHTYSTLGVFDVKVTGSGNNIRVYSEGLLEVLDWGVSKSRGVKFGGCPSLTTVPKNLPPLFTDLTNMFSSCYAFNSDVSGWDVSRVTKVNQLFYGCEIFNQDLSSWDVGNVTDFTCMFTGATLFNSDLSNWRTGQALSMYQMFGEARSFSGNVSGWDTSNVRDMSLMFQSCSSFNVDLSEWNIGTVQNTSSMFDGATIFNQDISNWNTANVINMNRMFANTGAFNHDLSGWNINSVSDHNNFDLNATGPGWNSGLKPPF